MSWPTVTLGEIFHIARDGSPRPIDKFLTESLDGVNWISIRDASNSSKYITRTEKRILKSGVSKSRTVKPGDFLLTNSMSFGRPYIVRTHGCIHDGWLVLSSQESVVDQDYFYHLLGSEPVYRKFKSLASGAVVKNLNTELVKQVTVPLPPLPEQRRIAAILDKADALRAKRREAIAKLDQLLQSVFLDMFGDPVTNPKAWPKRDFSESVDFLTGFPFKSDRFVPAGHGVKICRGTNVLPATLDWTDEANWRPEEAQALPKFRILPDDVIVAMDRPWISSGFKIVLVPPAAPECLLVQRVARLRTKQGLLSAFLHLCVAVVGCVQATLQTN